MKNLYLKNYFRINLLLVLTCLTTGIFAQTPKSGVSQLVTTITAYNEKVPGERVFLHYDKPYYAKGDTIWFKVYVVENSSRLPSSNSGLVYIELVNAQNVVAKRLMLPVVDGISWGDLRLEDDYSAGTYTIRGYTNWMRNFDNNYLFTERIEVVDHESQPWLISQATAVKGGKTQMALRLDGLDNRPYANKELAVTLKAGDNTVYKKQVFTSDSGVITMNLEENDKIINRQLLTTITGIAEKEKSVTFPVSLTQNRADVQFLPEGGYMIDNISCLVGFKAIGEDGKGVDIVGKVFNQEQKEILSFKSTHRGMGSFTILPQANAVYTAEIVFPDGSKGSFRLPEVKRSGTSIHVVNTSRKDSLDIQVTLSPEIVNDTQRYYLIGQSRNVVVCAATVTTRKAVFRTRIPKSIFHSGIAHFTLFDQENNPVNERLVFVNHGDNLRINIDTDQPTYSSRDSISLNVSVTDLNGKNIDGSFSVSVTDDSQVDPASNGSQSIVTYLELTSELRGYVEDPTYYFKTEDPQVAIALDNLLLTQGWIGHPWKKVFSNTPGITYLPEPGFTVRGKISTLFDKTPADMKVVLLSVGKDVLYKETSTDANGNFTFTDFAGLDTMQFVLKVRSSKNKSIPATIIIDEFKPLAAEPSPGPLLRPWYVRGDSTFLNYINDNLAHKAFIEKEKFKGDGKTLNEVVITSSRMVKSSKNLNGSGADQVIAEEMLKTMGSIDLLHIIQNQFKGFSLGYFSPTFGRAEKPGKPELRELQYLINGRKIALIIDGVNVETFFSGDSTRTAHADFFKYYLTNLTAPQLKGIEVMKSSDYILTYGKKFLSPGDAVNDYIFFEITTYSGNGAFYKDAPGIAVYRPLPLSLPREFYRPKYHSNEKIAGITDRRSTIHWEPEMTFENGKALISFYASDRTGSYTVIVQGNDKEGNLGYQVRQIVISPPVKTGEKAAGK